MRPPSTQLSNLLGSRRSIERECVEHGIRNDQLDRSFKWPHGKGRPFSRSLSTLSHERSANAFSGDAGPNFRRVVQNSLGHVYVPDAELREAIFFGIPRTELSAGHVSTRLPIFALYTNDTGYLPAG